MSTGLSQRSYLVFSRLLNEPPNFNMGDKFVKYALQVTFKSNNAILGNTISKTRQVPRDPRLPTTHLQQDHTRWAFDYSQDPHPHSARSCYQ